MKFGLIGPSYSLGSISAECQRTINWIPEIIESGAGRGPLRLCPSPGTKTFATLAGNVVRGLAEYNGRIFAVDDVGLSEVLSTGVVVPKGNMPSDALPASLAVGPVQLFIVTGGEGWCYDYAADTLAVALDPGTAGYLAPLSQCGYADGYYIALLDNSQVFQISALLACDAASWDLLDVAQVSVFPDNVQAMLLDHRELWLFGRKQTQVYYDSGNPDFPWDVNPQGFIEQGCLDPWSPVRLDNSILWLGGDERGARIAWRAEGYQPRRISNHAVETEWAGYGAPGEAIGYPYQDRGHAFWVLYFPSVNKTWIYDASTGLWSERGYWVNATSSYAAHRSQCHAYCFGKHLVGDWNSGKIYEMGNGLLDDDSNPIRRLRRTPHLTNEGKRIHYRFLQLDMQTGIGLVGVPGAPGVDPQVMVRWSNDWGRTWGNEHWVRAGRMGEYLTRVRLDQLGSAFQRTFEFVCTDPIPWAINEGFIEID